MIFHSVSVVNASPESLMCDSAKCCCLCGVGRSSLKDIPSWLMPWSVKMLGIEATDALTWSQFAQAIISMCIVMEPSS